MKHVRFLLSAEDDLRRKNPYNKQQVPKSRPKSSYRPKSSRKAYPSTKANPPRKLRPQPQPRPLPLDADGGADAYVFSCEGKAPGYYADVAKNCEVRSNQLLNHQQLKLYPIMFQSTPSVC